MNNRERFTTTPLKLETDAEIAVRIANDTEPEREALPDDVFMTPERIEEFCAEANQLDKDKRPRAADAKIITALVRAKVTIAALQKENNSLKAERRWIPVSEKLPDEKTPVLAIVGGYPFVIAYRNTERFDGDGWTYTAVSHWMPIPDAPLG